jgi:regulator of protease activity HflC (stomatin/prohibitin superfamily)
MSGKARLAEASQSRQIQVEQAKAELDASKLRAEAIKIMGKAAKEYPEYRQQEYMAAFGEALREGKMSQIIYIPTEANIPIMEANRASNIIQKD